MFSVCIDPKASGGIFVKVITTPNAEIVPVYSHLSTAAKCRFAREFLEDEGSDFDFLTPLVNAYLSNRQGSGDIKTYKVGDVGVTQEMKVKVIDLQR